MISSRLSLRVDWVSNGQACAIHLCLHAWQESSKCLLNNENQVLGGVFKIDFEMFREAWTEKESIWGKQSLRGAGV